MNLWLNENFFDNKKIDRLQFEQGADSVLNLLRLWFYAAKYAVDNLLDDDKIGVLKDFDDVDIERVGKWQGEKGSFANVLKSLNLIENKYGQYYIHDFLDNNPQLGVLIKQKISGSKYAKIRWNNKKMGDPIGDPIGESPLPHMQKEKKRKEKKRKDKDKRENPALPDWLNKEKWTEFEAMRKKMRKPLTEASIKLNLKILEDDKKNQDKIIDNAIRSDWQGLHPLKGKHAPVKPANHLPAEEGKYDGY